jgi:simple sugar transport system permease protein
VGALAFSLLIGLVVLALSGNDPLLAYAAMFEGAFGSLPALGRTLANATPLILTGIAVAFAFRAGLFNIGAEGQLFVGAIASAAIAPVVGATVGTIAALAGAMAAGGLFAGIAGWLKARFGAHEVITTIMLNFIGINFAYYMINVWIGADTQLPGTEPIADSTRLGPIAPALGEAHLGFVVAVAVALAATALLWRTARGYDLRVVGSAPDAARYAGISVATNTVVAMVVSGAFAGLAGGVEVLGSYGRMVNPFVTELGFIGIGVALLGRNHPIGCVVGGIVFGALAAGGQYMQLQLGISIKMVSILTGAALLFVTAERFIDVAGLRQRLMRRSS